MGGAGAGLQAAQISGPSPSFPRLWGDLMGSPWPRASPGFHDRPGLWWTAEWRVDQGARVWETMGLTLAGRRKDLPSVLGLCSVQYLRDHPCLARRGLPCLGGWEEAEKMEPRTLGFPSILPELTYPTLAREHRFLQKQENPG